MHMLGEDEEGPLGPTRHNVRQAFVQFRTLLIRPSLNIPVELLEEVEREVYDLEFSK